MERKIETKRFRWLAAMIMLVAAMVMPSTTWAQSTYTDDFVGGRTDFRDESIYFVLTTRFYDGDKSNNAYCWDHSAAGNGMDAEWRGDFKGLIEKLDYIKALGFTAVWISPVAENGSGYDYHGYHPIDFSKEDHRLQSKANAILGIAEDITFQTLVDEAHKRGMKIILDIVLNHTGNFGETNLCQLFRKDYNAVFEGDIDASMTPITVNDTDDQGNPGKLPADYSSLTGSGQYNSRYIELSNNDGVNHDSHNYWHHFNDLNSFNWDDHTAQYANIAGDCTDLNTENPAVYKYLREQYGRFIKMGVDGFRIDCARHISRLTFNMAFLPYFHELGEQYKEKRLNECPFFIFGEVCTRYNKVTYRDYPAMSSYFYTWQSDNSLMQQWDDNATYWDDKEIYAGLYEYGNIGLALQECYDNQGNEEAQPTSDNATLNGNEYHTPDVSQASGMNVIDFQMHRLFGKASDAFGIAKSGDNLYNDATFNVVYVDSHDYAPGSPSEQHRFTGGTEAWAENLDLMFTFRGIPCLYYGSEIEFKKGCYIDKGPTAPLKETGRAYYGGYITGDVTATGFGSYSDATGNLATTLSKPLARHIARLSQIRQQVPALRKGQYSTEGCDGTIAFKRRYTSGDIDSYVLVAISGTAIFSGVLNGTYTEVITGQTVTVNDGTLTSPEIAKGNMRIYVLNGNGKIGEDGPFLFDNTAATAIELTYDGHEEDDCEEAPVDCKLTFSPASETFTTETLDITITPTNKVKSAWYKIGEDGEKTDINIGEETKITIGEGIESGDIDIYYGCTSVYGLESNRKITYHKTGSTTPGTDGITIYVKGDEAPYIYAGDQDWMAILGPWPGTKMKESTTINGEQFWYYTITGYNSFNYIINDGSNGNQTGELTADGDRYHDESWNDITGEITGTPTRLTLTVLGDEALLGAMWDQTNTDCDMQTEDNKTYTLTLLNLTLKAGNYNYKVCQDHTWDTTYPAGDNAVVTIPMNGKYDITFTYNVGDDSPTATIKPSEGETFVIYYAQLLSPQGVTTNLTTRRNDNGIWTSALTLNEDGEYTITVTGSDNSSYPYKFTPEAGLPYQMNFNEETHELSVSVRTLTLTVAGNQELFGVEWNQTNTDCDMQTEDNKTYTLTLLNLTLKAGNYNYKVCQDHTWVTTYPAGDNAVVTIPEAGTYDITFSYKYGDEAPTAVATKSGAATGVDSIGMTGMDSKHNVIFDLQGRKVSKPAKGLYIRNGKKLFVR